VAGSTGYKATFYGTSGNDLGNCIKLITQTSCTGSQSQTFLMVFGTVGATGMPVKISMANLFMIQRIMGEQTSFLQPSNKI